ncbi:MAG: HD domain-containing phosphohydrolase [Candidatus Omnitrophota bacterium]
MVDLISSNILLSAPLAVSNGQFDSIKQNLVDISKSIGAGLSLLDKNMEIVWINDTMASWFGPIHKIKGTKCHQTYEKRNDVCPNCPVKKVFDTNQDLCIRIRPGFNSVGEKRLYRIFAKPVRTKSGSIRYVLELVQDVTDEKRKFSELRTRLRFMRSEVDSLKRLSEDFASSFELDKTIKDMLATTKNLLHADGCCFHLVSDNGGRVDFRVIDMPNCLKRKEHRELCNSLSQHVATTKRPATLEGTCSFLSVPISFGNQVVGVISIFNRRPYRFSTEEKYLLMTFANQSAILIGNKQLYLKLHMSYLGTIKALVSTIEAKDPYTKGHSEKVTTYAIRIAKALRLNKDNRRLLSYCGRLHDIGKIAVSDVILNKPGPLTNVEFDQITTHPLKGAEILRHLDFLKDGVLAIRHHHERFDGGGYPDGLKSDGIPILARILAIADSYDAMTSDRAYRKGMPQEKAVEELKRCSGHQFDPSIVDAFLSGF